ncbi:MAG: cytochrome c family protein [Aestuariivirga sp.]|nr:cytochrome c family protein [Aestuariivirga sp.]
MTICHVRRGFGYCGPALAVFLLAAGPAQADGDVAKGEQVFKKCMACHTVSDKTNKVGPHLVGVVGRPVASVEGYKYSDDMKAYGATGAVWDEAALQAYLEKPKAVVAKTKMAFAGLNKVDERADLIAFLKTKM